MNSNKKYDLEERLLQYSVDIVKFVDSIPKTRVGNLIVDQLIRSGTSPYPNHAEGRAQCY